MANDQLVGEEEIYKETFTRKDSVAILNTDREQANDSNAFKEDFHYGGPAHGLFTSKTFDLPNDFYGSIEFKSETGFISSGVNMRYFQNEMLKIGFVEIYVENKVCEEVPDVPLAWNWRALHLPKSPR
ncbi:hypothetical protein DFA_08994 [Cavenderia fasciculata]|uniref:Uncharacterized protein n=1 Tax=Cavenderia fasciculata TaxID=261658 RepID=F4Q6E6_CACFS|nr:uncharacterized protein DFA_08994 [Cavenderia fasciculata]EGG16456.1 hypothetical protein DFA_08994 [Cavenderia fasciculata]|eukprot:XP_004354856.1 hypothetical protein DFA_08994 [Cavenderia fasciculata]